MMSKVSKSPLRVIKRRKCGSADQLRKVLWAAITGLKPLLSSEDNETRTRGSHALAAVAGVYLKSLDMSEVAARLEAIEESLNRQSEKAPRRYPRIHREELDGTNG